MPSLTSRITRMALRRSLAGGSPGWFYVGVAGVALGAVRRLIAEPPTVYTTELRSGEGLEIRSIRPSR